MTDVRGTEQPSTNDALDLELSEYVVGGGGIHRTSDGAFQMFGLVCPDCRPLHSVGWCHSDRHPIFDSTGRLIQMTRVPGVSKSLVRRAA